MGGNLADVGGGLTQGAAPVVVPASSYFLFWGANILNPGLGGFFQPNGTPLDTAVAAAAGGAGSATDHNVPITGTAIDLVGFMGLTTTALTVIRLYLNSVPFVDTTMTGPGTFNITLAAPVAVTQGQRLTLRHLSGPVCGITSIGLRLE